MKLTLKREIPKPEFTHGSLYVDGVFECFTLEDCVREGEKVPGKTAIPYGTYKVIINYSNRFKRLMPLLLDVPNFTGVRIHSGNDEHDTEGCPLVGQLRGHSSLLKSRAAYSALFKKLERAFDRGQEITIEVTK